MPHSAEWLGAKFIVNRIIPDLLIGKSPPLILLRTHTGFIAKSWSDCTVAPPPVFRVSLPLEYKIVDFKSSAFNSTTFDAFNISSGALVADSCI